MSDIRFIELYATPVIVERIADGAALGEALAQVSLDRCALDPGLSVSNLGGWHSDRRMMDWGGEASAALARHAIRLADQFTVDIGADPAGARRFAWGVDMWANIARTGDAGQYHCHPGAWWSAVFYADDGYDGSDDRALGGELSLMDPRMPAIRQNMPDLRIRHPGRPHDEHEQWLRPETGMLLLFPAWLTHAVRPYRGAGERISIALNLSAIAKTGA